MQFARRHARSATVAKVGMYRPWGSALGRIKDTSNTAAEMNRERRRKAMRIEGPVTRPPRAY
jgi:hypothetical protein